VASNVTIAPICFKTSHKLCQITSLEIRIKCLELIQRLNSDNPKVSTPVGRLYDVITPVWPPHGRGCLLPACTRQVRRLLESRTPGIETFAVYYGTERLTKRFYENLTPLTDWPRVTIVQLFFLVPYFSFPSQSFHACRPLVRRHHACMTAARAWMPAPRLYPSGPPPAREPHSRTWNFCRLLRDREIDEKILRKSNAADGLTASYDCPALFPCSVLFPWQA